MLRMSVLCLVLMVLFALAESVEAEKAEEAATTDELPAALIAAGIGHTSVLDARYAHAIRGEGGYSATRVFYTRHESTGSRPAPAPCIPACTKPCSPGKTEQHKAFAVAGTAQGTVVLVEGGLGEFQHIQETPTSATMTQGTFGGLAGVIGSTSDGRLAFQMEGKALRETLLFTGAYQQIFGQVYSR